MTGPLRVVIDPNVWISALLSPAGASADVVRAVLAGEVTAVVSPQLLDELATVLARPKFRRWIDAADAEDFVGAVAARGEPHPDVPEPAAATRDHADDDLVALSASAQARLVTGDDDLLSADLDPPALSPRALIGLLRPN